MNKAIGIDLGTTNSCVAVVEGEKPTVITTAEGERTTPSVVAFAKDGTRIVGTTALRQSAMNASRTIYSVKRHMGSKWSAKIDGQKFSAPQISAMILRKMRTDAEKYLGTTVSDAVITVPAYFNDMQRQATKDAGKIAGLNVLRIINEPTAAALAYGLDNGNPQKVMVYDLGGGTFDVSIIEIGEGVIEVLATAGDNHLGGDDFDECITNYLVAEFRRESGVDISRDETALARMREAATNAKKDLSAATSATVNLPFLAQGASGANVGGGGNGATGAGSTAGGAGSSAAGGGTNAGGPVHFEHTLTRAQFENMTRDLVERTAGPVMQALNDAGIAASELGCVLLVGGSTRIPAVQQKVKELTGKEPANSVNPDECVATGAAIQADTLMRAQTGTALATRGSEILLLDVVPLSLSIETLGGVATRIVERNTTLPAHYSQVFTTAASFQTSVEIHVMQGERPMAADNKTIGKFRLKGIKRARAGVPQIEVTFDIDANGILVVSAKDLDTGREQSITIEDNDRLSDAEIQAAIRDAEQYAAQDAARKQSMNVRDSAQRLVNEVNTALSEVKKELSKEEKRQIQADMLALTKALNKRVEKGEEPDTHSIEAARDALDKSSAHARNLYEQKQQS